MPETDQEIRAAALELAQGISRFLEDQLGDQLLGFYLLGSLAHGGFNRRYSDIDVGLVTEDGIDEALSAAIKAEAAKLSPVLAPKLSLFWADRQFSIGRFPPLDRLDYLDKAVPLVERERIVIDRPTLSEVRAYLRGAPFENWASGTKKFAALTTLDPENHKPYLRAHLYPARFAYSWRTGKMASNDDAVEYLNKN
ncbi:MAG: nucleotidyltransferase domain-containing protein, partial [Rhodospirillaceae bacterium]|nr:nucleotidyltransferase domain-containing protein [Rhodospirillaceae bacterium]